MSRINAAAGTNLQKNAVLCLLSAA